MKPLRRNIGVVMQNSKLFLGDIFSNITISAPRLAMDKAWQAAELSGIAEDIRRMPMGMHTIICAGSGVSGGQRQRLMINVINLSSKVFIHVVLESISQIILLCK